MTRGVRKRPKANDGYHPVEMLVGIGVGMGLKREDIAALAGISTGTVDNRRKSEFAEWVAQKTKEAASKFILETREDVNREFKKRWGKALDVVDEAMAATKADGSRDFNAALRAVEMAFDRPLGRPTQKAEVVSEHTETVVHAFPAEVLRFIEQKTRPQLVEAAVIDVEAE